MTNGAAPIRQADAATVEAQAHAFAVSKTVSSAGKRCYRPADRPIGLR